MTSAEIRQQFLDFFKSKEHLIVPSAPIVVKNDPTLLFTNAGMNQFKDYFLGNKEPESPRIADTQKCLRVSGKHNDLEEVGVDTYHHTMFEMLGNWSFGNYFKTEAIAWSWELLAEVFKIPKDRLYVSVFEGDAKENLPKDEEAFNEWKKWVNEDRIISGKKKDNFWEMGDTGPCGPCTEIHVDCRPDEERKLVDGKALVNNDHPQVIEIWNNVFIQFNRLKDGSLEPLPARHVDTGMGFERLVRVLQGKSSNYDTDVFTGTIAATENITGKKYDALCSPSFGGSWREAVSFRVIADHIRAISFTIADGQLPSNTGAGYVIRRILRRAVRYYYSYLDYKQPLLHQLVPVLAKQFENVFPELYKQQDFVSKVVKEEEDAFLRTLESGLKRMDIEIKKRITMFNINLLNSLGYIYDDQRELMIKKIGKDDFYSIPLTLNSKAVEILSMDNPDVFKGWGGFLINYKKELELSGKTAFLLYDTYGFPFDLTCLIASENNLTVDEAGFEIEMQQQKTRSRAATTIDTEDWVVLDAHSITEFVGYDSLEVKTKVVKYRKVKSKGKESYQVVLAATPFYAESGGQVGDTGFLHFEEEEVEVIDTKKENNLYIQFTDKLPAHIDGEVRARVNPVRRQSIETHHSATHLLHAALRKVLGKHVAQKGSLVNDEYLRFDFSHFAKVTDEEIAQVEAIVNEKIRENVEVVIKQMPKEEALKLGAMALFGEKYGDRVRVVTMDQDYSVELCGGTHVGYTGEIGFFKIKHESAVAAGVRRIEAISGRSAEALIHEQYETIKAIRESLKNPKEILKAVDGLVAENNELKKKIESLEAKQLIAIKAGLLKQVETVNGISFIGSIVEVSNADALKKLCFDLKPELTNYVVVLAANIEGKANVAVLLDDAIVTNKGLEAPKMIKEHVAPLIKGGGGGQKTLATAGGQDASNLDKVIEKIKELL